MQKSGPQYSSLALSFEVSATSQWRHTCRTQVPGKTPRHLTRSIGFSSLMNHGHGKSKRLVAIHLNVIVWKTAQIDNAAQPRTCDSHRPGAGGCARPALLAPCQVPKISWIRALICWRILLLDITGSPGSMQNSAVTSLPEPFLENVSSSHIAPDFPDVPDETV